jgi:murein L,D-transpeptidase YcbB/YkuD
LAAILLVLAGGTAHATNAPTAPEIRQSLESSVSLADSELMVDRTRLITAYRARDFKPVWAGHPDMVNALVAALSTSATEGIGPESLGLDALKSVLANTHFPPVERELLLSDRYLGYAQVLAQGRVAAAAIERDWLLDRPDFDPAAAMSRLDRSGDVAGSLQELAPRSADYARLRDALHHYEEFASTGSWQPIRPDGKIEPGQTGELVKILKARLEREGDLPEAQAGGDIYDTPLAAAVTRFQKRHGLNADGRIGRATIAALNVPPAQRADAIRLNLERWRSMPRDWPARRVVVNTAAAVLTLYRDGAPQLSSRVIVGTPTHPSPVLSAQIEAVLFNPPWNVPTSIVRREIQPQLRRDPGYLVRNHFVILGRKTGGSGDIDWRKTSILGSGWQLQQKPGPWNSLGRIKLELPNPRNVYLHDTPLRGLFQKSIRTLSHGCIRVDDIKGLASMLLGEGWPIEVIEREITQGITHRVALRQKVPVYLIYLSAFVDADGVVQFRDDAYRRDERLRAVLARKETLQPVAEREMNRHETACAAS